MTNEKKLHFKKFKKNIINIYLYNLALLIYNENLKRRFFKKYKVYLKTNKTIKLQLLLANRFNEINTKIKMMKRWKKMVKSSPINFLNPNNRGLIRLRLIHSLRK